GEDGAATLAGPPVRLRPATNSHRGSATMEISCPDTRWLQELTAGHLPESAWDQLEEHLRQCPRCRQSGAAQDRLSQSSTVKPGRGADTLVPSDSTDDRSVTHCLPETPPPAGESTGTPPSRSLSFLAPGDRLENYLVLCVLGQGGMGKVFKAKDTVLDRTVAI